MARASGASQPRTLSLTEELERLEQSITLTLQEIDHNFSKAHRIVTSSILPIVEQYAEHSREVWEGSKFWKQFFESSANVSLSGYEEQPSMHELLDETATEESNATTHTTLETSQSYETPSSEHISQNPAEEDLDLSALTISPSHSTPRPNQSTKQANPDATATFADYPSPYEALRQEIGPTNPTNPAPGTPNRAPNTADIAMTPSSSPFLPPGPNSDARPTTARKKTDPLLHRVLDRNYRVQATPLASNSRRPNPAPAYALTTPATNARNKLFDSTLSSSPDTPAPPQLHAEIFSPLPKNDTRAGKHKARTPGVSVLTPAKAKASALHQAGVWDSDDDELDEADYDASPPKTIQFHVPQSRLLKTPAKVASRRIVAGLLASAGLGTDDDLDDDFTDNIDHGGMMNDPTSPSVVRGAPGLEDESF